MKMNLDANIAESHRQKICEGLAKFLADTYSLYIKTQNFHWNVTGPHFNSLHTMFELQYRELAEAIDTVAERIRALGQLTPASYTIFSKLSSIPEESAAPKAEEMVRQLAEGHTICAKTAKSFFPLLDEAQDPVTADLLTERIQIHEKTAWMLRSFLE